MGLPLGAMPDDKSRVESSRSPLIIGLDGEGRHLYRPYYELYIRSV
jgi:hypothetical protein